MHARVVSIIALLSLGLGTGCDPAVPSGSGEGSTSGGQTPSTSTSGPATSPPTTGVTTTTTATTTATGGLPPGEGCCAAHDGPGCDEAPVQQCVCDQDAACCTFDWTVACAQIAEARCDATCQPNPTTGSDSGPTTGVITDSTGSSGSTGYGSTGYGSTGYGSTGFYGTGGTDTGGFDEGSCCSPNEGCAHDATEACVCDLDATCCEGNWNEGCVALATNNCNACTSDDCCTPQNDAGCSDAVVQDCVCDLDPYCCDVEYDFICADLAQSSCSACTP